MKLHLFNPENDLALGLGCDNYTPPPHAAALHRAGALLPLWWADEGDAVVAPLVTETEREAMLSRFGLKVNTQFDPAAVAPSPWGWSRDARRQFVKAGVVRPLLPDDDAIERYRQLSHRQTAVRLLEEIGYEGVMPLVTDSPETAMKYIGRHGSCFVKSPWSGSGRGVFNTSGLGAGPLFRRLEGIVHRQGSVIVEKALDKVMDFAALYYSDGNGVSLSGLSVFRTEPRGMYTGNIVAPQSCLMEMVASRVGEAALDSALGKVGDALTTIVGRDYSGWLGVDMMVTGDGGKESIMPCIEINLRMTMGVTAMKVAEKLGVISPRFLTWRHDTENICDRQWLIPPRDGFALILE